MAVIVNRLALQRLARLRLREARLLLREEMYPGAYYMSGYVVECALKACIAKQTARHDFPDKQRGYDCFTHKLSDLLKLAGLEPSLTKDSKLHPALGSNWATVRDWSEESRYRDTIVEQSARDMLAAITAKQVGVYSWVRERW